MVVYGCVWMCMCMSMSVYERVSVMYCVSHWVQLRFLCVSNSHRTINGFSEIWCSRMRLCSVS